MSASPSHRVAARAGLRAAAAQLRTVPHWRERVAAGVLSAGPGELALTAAERGDIEARRARIFELRHRREVRCRPAWLSSSPQRRYVWRGLPVLVRIIRETGRRSRARCMVEAPGAPERPTRRAAVRAWLWRRERLLWQCRGLALVRQCVDGHRLWALQIHRGRHVHSIALWYRPPTTAELRTTWRRWYAAQPRPARRPAPDTLGWRAWTWGGKMLRSPMQDTPWPDGELRDEDWDGCAVLRSRAGIHALLLPRDWRRADWRHSAWCGHGPHPWAGHVHGVVERYGRYLLGADGWRAQWVVIRALVAPDVATWTALAAAYPHIPVHLSPRADEARGACEREEADHGQHR